MGRPPGVADHAGTPRASQTAPHRVAVILYPGFDELDAFGPYEVLRMAHEEGGGIEVELVTRERNADVTASHGTVIRPRFTLRDGTWDVVLVPGGGWVRHQGAFTEAQRGELPKVLAALHRDGATVGSVCTGAMLLAAGGLTAGRPAITHPVTVEALRQSGAEIVPARVVDDGDLITSGGITSGLDLGLWLVERLCDRALADLIAGRMQYARVDDIHLGPRFEGNRFGSARRRQGSGVDRP